MEVAQIVVAKERLKESNATAKLGRGQRVVLAFPSALKVTL